MSAPTHKSNPLAPLRQVTPFLTMLFLLLFSGPPKFRIRDAEASVYGELDPVAILQVVVWLVAGAWVARELWLSHKGKRPPLLFTKVHKLSALLIALLAASAFTSLAAPLTLFKTYQVAIEFLFCLMFIQWHGIEKFLDLLLAGDLLLCALIGTLVVVAPSFVFAETETGAIRLEARQIYEASIVGGLAFILLLCRKRRIAGFWFWLSLSGFLLIAALTRSAWIAVASVLALAAWFRPTLPRIKVVYLICAAAVLAFLLGATSELNRVRDPSTVYDLSDRVGLWTYMTDAVLERSPAMGLGYVAGPRVLGPEYNPALAAGHSMFFEVFIGGGFVSLSVFLVLIAALALHAWRLLRKHGDPTQFTVAALFVAIVVLGLVTGELDSTPFSFTFWGMATALPLLAAPETAFTETARKRVIRSVPLPEVS
jgi:O-Antigen ligase